MNDRPDEMNVQSFIVKIWVEETDRDLEKETWRGYITHVTSGERQYVKSLEEITDYFRGYLVSLDGDGSL